MEYRSKCEMPKRQVDGFHTHSSEVHGDHHGRWTIWLGVNEIEGSFVTGNEQAVSRPSCEMPFEGQSMWDSASITLGCAKRSLFYFILFYFM